MIASFAGRPPGRNTHVVLVNADNGDERPLGEARFFSVEGLFWVGDGSAVVFDAVEVPGGRWNWNSQLWSIAYPAGALRRITPNDASYLTAAATKDGRTLVTIRDELRASLWVAPDGDSTRARPITRSSTGREGAVGIEWTLDGRIVYTAVGHDHWNLWIAKSDGSESRQLTNDGGAQPQLRPDGTGLFFLAGATDGARDSLHGSRRQQCSIDRNGRTDLPRDTFEVSETHLYLNTQSERHVRNVPCADRRRGARASVHRSGLGAAGLQLPQPLARRAPGGRDLQRPGRRRHGGRVDRRIGTPGKDSL